MTANIAGASLPTLPGGRLGLELYSLRNELKADLAGALEQVREWGFEEVEACRISGHVSRGHRTRAARAPASARSASSPITNACAMTSRAWRAGRPHPRPRNRHLRLDSAREDAHAGGCERRHRQLQQVGRGGGAGETSSRI